MNLVQNLPPNFNFDKKELIDYTFSRCRTVPTSFADLGGVWGVDGAYTFYALHEYKVNHAVLVDFCFTDAVTQKSQSESKLKLIQGNFGDETIIKQVGKVDAVFLFDVLLHQVKPDWNEILNNYSKNTQYFVVFNQQWIGSDKTVRLLDLGREKYFKNVPHDKNHPTYRDLFDKLDEFSPIHKRIWKDIPDVWQWGITDRDLLQCMDDLGFRMKYYKDCGLFGSLHNFECHGFVFQKIK